MAELGPNDGAEPYFPPTDPVTLGGQIIGGFSPTSMNQLDVEKSSLDEMPGDEALADAIRRKLRQDAATADLDISVEVVAGTAFLRGVVPGLEDVENVEDVASRTPGIRFVFEGLEIDGC